MNNKEKFINTYENIIKPLREDYYKNKVKQGLVDNVFNKSLFIINLAPIIIAIFLCTFGQFTLKSTIITLLFLLISNIFISTIKKQYNIYESNYELEIRKMGFLSINQYEKNIKKFITGENGYYKEVLQNLISTNNFTKENIYNLKDLKGRTYIIRNNEQNNELYIINNNLKDLPTLTKLKYDNIRYYRLDKNNNRIILKTDMDEWYYEKENEIVFKNLIPNKSIASENVTKKEEYINDFKRYMSRIKNKDIIKNNENDKIKANNKSKAILLIILEIILILLLNLYTDYKLWLSIFYIIILIGINHYLLKYLQIKNSTMKSDKDYILYLNNNKDCQDKFAELKLALNIPNEVQKIYSDEGAEFLTWNNEGYFHLFLNLIYFDVIYLSVKIADVDYYKIEDNYCILKIKGKKYSFTKEAEDKFSKLLPNKEYNWVKGQTLINK